MKSSDKKLGFLRLAGCALALGALACGDDGTGPGGTGGVGPVATITFAQPTLSFAWLKQEIRLGVVAQDAQGNVVADPQLSFTTSDAGVVTVDAAGVVAAQSEGSADVTATVGAVSATVGATVTVASLAGAVEEIAFVGVTVIPMDSERRLEDHTVLVSGGWITEVGPADQVQVPSTADVVDGAGLFLMPGLLDAHVHPRIETDLLPYVANGVTSALDMATSDEGRSLNWRSRVESGTLVAPTLWVGAIVDGPNGITRGSKVVSNAASARQFVADMSGHFIKVYNSVPASAFDVLMQEANSRGIPVASHGVRAPGMNGVLSAGVQMIAHGEEYYYTHFNNQRNLGLIPSAIQMTVDAGAFVTINLSTFEAITGQWGNQAGLDVILNEPEIRFLNPAWVNFWINSNPYIGQSGDLTPVFEFLRTMGTDFHAGGVPFILGTDSPGIPGMFPGFSIHDELRTLIEIGLTPYQALAAGTKVSGEFLASFFRGSQRVGTVEVGKRADLILLTDDPLLDVANVRNRAGVMLRGRWFAESELQQMMEDLAASLGS